MSKQCSTCRETKSLDEFYFKDAKRVVRKSICKVCFNRRPKSRSPKTLEWVKRYQGEYARGVYQPMVRQHASDAKAGGCVVCGYDRCLEALHFHHVGDGKDKAVSRCRSVASVDREIAKCVLLCANCHTEVHSNPDYTRPDHPYLPVGAVCV